MRGAGPAGDGTVLPGGGGDDSKRGLSSAAFMGNEGRWFACMQTGRPACMLAGERKTEGLGNAGPGQKSSDRGADTGRMVLSAGRKAFAASSRFLAAPCPSRLPIGSASCFEDPVSAEAGLQKRLQAVETVMQERLELHREALKIQQAMPGIDRVAAASILAGPGPEMSVFGSARAFAARAGLSPGNNEDRRQARPRCRPKGFPASARHLRRSGACQHRELPVRQIQE